MNAKKQKKQKKLKNKNVEKKLKIFFLRGVGGGSKFDFNSNFEKRTSNLEKKRI